MSAPAKALSIPLHGQQQLEGVTQAPELSFGFLQLGDESHGILPIEGQRTWRQHHEGPTPVLQFVEPIHGIEHTFVTTGPQPPLIRPGPGLFRLIAALSRSPRGGTRSEREDGPVPEPTDELAHLWSWFAEAQFRNDSPLYERIALAVSADRDLLEVVRAAPPAAHMPPTLLGAVHYLLLDGLDHPLADVYAGRSDADPAPLFLDICRIHHDEVVALLTTRHVQTNDCGRSAVIGIGLTWLASLFDDPFALVDVGASAGINLLCDHYRIDYGTHGTTGPIDSPVEINCRVLAGDPPVADRLPPLVARGGIDRAPIDLTDPDDARWLLACVWPDTGRLERTAASIRLVRDDPPTIVAGDAVETLPWVLAELPSTAVPVIVTTSAFGYLSIDDRSRFVFLLEAESHRRRLAWLSSEGAGIVEAFAGEVPPGHDHSDSEVLGAVTFDGGTSSAHLLGFAHKHGTWVDWRGPKVGSKATRHQ